MIHNVNKYHRAVLRILIVLVLSISYQSKSYAQFNTDRIISIGRNALYFEDYVLSIQYFNQVIKLKPYLTEPYLLRAIAKINLADYTGALKDLNICIDNNPFQPGAYYTRGYVYRQLNEYKKAEQDFNNALLHDPDNKTYILLRADAKANQQLYTEALKDIDYLLKREPNDPTLLFEKGVISLNNSDTTTAIQCIQQSATYDSQNPANWSALGVIYLQMGQEIDAMNYLTQSINLGSKWAGDYINRGVLHYKGHNYKAALADYNQAITLEPQNPQCYYNRGMLRYELGDYNNALTDFNQAIDLNPNKHEMYYQRAIVNMQLRQWESAIKDLDVLIQTYPYFLPSYHLIAQAHTKLGHDKQAYTYRQSAIRLEEKKDSIQSAKKNALDTLQTPNTDIQIAKAQPQKRDRRKEFSARAAQSQVEQNQQNKPYQSQTRGDVQNRYTDVINRNNISLSYYGNNDGLIRTNYSHSLIEQINHQHYLPAPLRLTEQEISLTVDMVNLHFEQITRLSNQIDLYGTNFKLLDDKLKQHIATLYFARAIEFALVQDYESAIDDCTRAIILDHTFYLAYFARANWRYKIISVQRYENDNNQEVHLALEIMLRDYDFIINKVPDFHYAYYNKANILCTQKEFRDAISYYSKAIQIDEDFAEAYFNRGLTYIYIDEIDKGIDDLSKAGELGIYQAYNLISRFK